MRSQDIQSLFTDETAFSQWLAEVNKKDALAAGSEVYKLINTLKKQFAGVEPERLRQIVVQLTPLVLYLSGLLEKSYLKKTTQHKIAQLNIGLLRQLAALHLQAAETAQDMDKVLHYHHALQMQGMVHYHCVLSYQRPSASAWREMGVAFQEALKLKIVTVAIGDCPPVLQKLNSIEKVVKRNLLFAICNAYCLQPEEIQALFDFCGELQKFVELGRLGERNREGFCWPYAEEQLPYPVYGPIDSKAGLVFNAEQIAKAQRLGQLVWPLENPAPVIEALINYKETASSSPLALPGLHVFISESERVFRFFSRHIQLGQVWTMNSPTPDNLNFSSLELYHEERRKVERIDREDIWGKPKQERLNLGINEFGALKTFKTDTTGFFVSEAIKAPLKDQDLLAFYGKDLKPHLGVVRRLEAAKLQNIQKALIQVLPGQVKSISLPDSEDGDLAVLLTHQETTQLLTMPQKYATGSVLNTSAGTVVLERLLEVTPYFMRYRIVFGDSG